MVYGGSTNDQSFDVYLTQFGLKECNEMKIQSVEMLNLIEKKKALLVNVRMRDEYEARNLPFAKHIPLNELPKRINEFLKDKLIFVVCPYNGRANIARLYLTPKGNNAKYLSDGILKTVDFFKRDHARNLSVK